MLGVFATMASSTIVNVAIPDIMRFFDTSAVSAQFVLTAFIAAMTLAMPLVGWMMGRWGVRTVMVCGLLVFAASSFVAAVAPTLAVVVAARFVQGGAAGVVQPVALLALYLAFPLDRRGSAIGMHALALVVAPAVGPWLGGLAVEGYGWRAVFAGAVPIAIVSAGAAWIFIPRRQSPGHKTVPLDLAGCARLALAFTLLFVGVWEFARPGGSGAVAVATVCAGMAAAVIFVRGQLASAAPLIQLRLLSEPAFRAACSLGLLLGAGLYGSTLMVPLFAQLVLGLPADQSGLLLLPAGIVLIAVSPIAGKLGNRHALAPLIAVGLAVFAISNLAFLSLNRHSGFMAVAAALAIGRAGLGLASPLTNLAAMRAFDDHCAAQSAALISFARQFGAIAGVVGLSAIVGASVPPGYEVPDPDAVLWAFHAAFATAGMLLLAGLVAVRSYARHGKAQLPASEDQQTYLVQAVAELPFAAEAAPLDEPTGSVPPSAKSG